MSTQDAPGPIPFAVEFFWSHSPNLSFDPKVIAAAVASESEIGAVATSEHVVSLDGLAQRFNAEIPPVLLFSSIFEVEPERTDIPQQDQAQWWWLQGRQSEALAAMKFGMGMSEMVVGKFAAEYPPRLFLDIYAAAIRAFIREYRPEVVHILHSNAVYFAPELLAEFDSGQYRPVDLACNIRVFNIAGATEDEFLVDSLGLHVFGLPDVQMHAIGSDRKEVTDMVWATCNYLLDYGDVFNDGDTLGERYYRCQHEHALVSPSREVIDINDGSRDT